MCLFSCCYVRKILRVIQVFKSNKYADLQFHFRDELRNTTKDMPPLAFHTLKPRGASRFPDWLKLKGQMSLIIGRLLTFLYFHISLRSGPRK